MRRLAIILLSLWQVSASAEDLKEIYNLAQAYDPTFKAQESAYEAGRQAMPQAIATFMPRISGSVSTSGVNQVFPANLASGTVRRTDVRSNQKSYTLSLTQPIYRPEQWAKLEQARHIEKQALATYLASSQDLIIRVSEQYFAVLSAKDDLYFSKAQRKAFARQLEQTQQRFDVGLIAITDVHEGQARLDSATANVIAAENNLADQYEKLREITSIPIADIATLKANDHTLLQPPSPNEQEAWVDTAQVYNLDIIVAREASLVAKSDVASRMTGHFPSVDLNANIQRNKGAVPRNTLSKEKTVNLSLSVPIFEGGGVTFRVKEAQARYEEAQRKLDIQRRSIHSTARQKYRGVLTQISQVKSLAQAVVSNQSALKATQAAYEVGTRTIVDVLDAESNLLRAQRDYAKARYEYVLEGLRLKRAAGTLKSEDIDEVNALLDSTA